MPVWRGKFETLGQCKDYAGPYPIETGGLTSIIGWMAEVFMRLKYQRYGRALRARHEVWIHRRSPRTAAFIRQARQKDKAAPQAMRSLGVPGANDNVAGPESDQIGTERLSRSSS